MRSFVKSRVRLGLATLVLVAIGAGISATSPASAAIPVCTPDLICWKEGEPPIAEVVRTIDGTKLSCKYRHSRIRNCVLRVRIANKKIRYVESAKSLGDYNRRVTRSYGGVVKRVASLVMRMPGGYTESVTEGFSEFRTSSPERIFPCEVRGTHGFVCSQIFKGWTYLDTPGILLDGPSWEARGLGVGIRIPASGKLPPRKGSSIRRVLTGYVDPDAWVPGCDSAKPAPWCVPSR